MRGLYQLATLHAGYTFRTDQVLIVTIGYKADLLVYIHVVHNFILDLNRLIHFALAFCVCFTRLKSSGPVRNGYITANKADLLTQTANCKLGNVSALAHLLKHYASRLYESMRY